MGVFLLLLFHSFTAKAILDSLLYPKAQLDAFKGRVAAAKKYADTATVLFRSVAQSPALSFRVSGISVLPLQKAIAAGKPRSEIVTLLEEPVPADTFLLLYPFTRDTFTIKSKRSFTSAYPSNGQELKTYEHTTTDYKTVSVQYSKAQWIYRVKPKTKNNPATFNAYLTDAPFQSRAIPLCYSRAVHYLKQLAGNGWPKWATFNKQDDRLPDDPSLKAFYAYIDAIAPHPFYSSNDIAVSGDLTNEQRDSLSRVYKKWRVSRLGPIDSAYAQDPAFKDLIIRATTATLRRQEPNLGLVELLARFGDPKAALEINNFRFAYPFMCGNDYGIRKLFLETARLAAQANEWPVFIWTHLFLSSSDKSGWERIVYDWDNRYAYTRELEYLGIDVPKLLLGMALETDSKRRKSIGGISAIWRESSQPKAIAETFANAAQDTSLDLYNRMIC